VDRVIRRDPDLFDRVGKKSPSGKGAHNTAIDEAMSGGLEDLDTGNGAVGPDVEKKYADLEVPADAGWK
jgi:hypothetical protein